MAVTIDNWRDQVDKRGYTAWQPAPATSHLKEMRMRLFVLGEHQIEVTFRAKTSSKGKVYPESTYRYSWKDFESATNVFNELIVAAHPGEILDAWIKKAGVKYIKV